MHWAYYKSYAYQIYFQYEILFQFLGWNTNIFVMSMCPSSSICVHPMLDIGFIICSPFFSVSCLSQSLPAFHFDQVVGHWGSVFSQCWYTGLRHLRSQSKLCPKCKTRKEPWNGQCQALLYRIRCAITKSAELV